MTFNVVYCVQDPHLTLCSTGSPLVVTVGGDVFETVLPDMIPGKMYQVSVSGVKGLEESDPSTDTVITGWFSTLFNLPLPLLRRGVSD